jgi:cytidylate kinase
VIAPEAEVKLFVTARPEIRAERRFAELLRMGLNVHLADVLADIRARDARDTGRGAAPLRQADDAILLDTSDMNADEAARRAIDAAKARLAASGQPS